MTRKYFPIFISIVLILLSSLSIFGLILQSTNTLDTNVAITLREQPGTNQASIGQIEPGEEFSTLESQNGWLYIETIQQETGWIPEWQLNNLNITDDQSIAGQAITNAVLFAENSVSSIALETIPEASYFPINYESDGWAQIEFSGRVGFVRSSQIKILSRDEVPEEELEKQQVSRESEQSEPEEETTVNENTVIMRQSNQAFLEEPDLNSTILYTPNMYEEFQFISSTENDHGEFYLVANRNGNRGYIESRVVSFATDSLNHVSDTGVTSMSDAVIVIDAGHGGSDPGAVSQDENTYEKNVTLSTSIFLQEYLEAMGATVIQVRSSDTDVSLAERAQISNDNEADAFISLHYDASYDPTYSGTTTYYYQQDDYDLAQTVNNHLEGLPLENLGVMYGNFQVTRENNRPALLLELGYMSNQNDLSYIRSEEYQRAVAEAIANGIREHIEQ